MITATQRLDGVVTFWSAGSFYHRQVLDEGLTALGLGDLVPNHSTNDANLRYSLNRIFDNTSFMIRPNKGGFNIIEEKKGEKDEPNQFVHRFTFWLDGPEHNQLMMSPLDRGKGMEVTEKYGEFCTYVTQHAVTRSLVAVIGKLQGIPLRPTGGVYWLPADAIPLWEQVGQVVEKAPAYGGANIYQIKHAFDEQAVRAVRDALVEDATAQAARIEKEIMDETLGAKALENRRAEANDIITKLTYYERMLSTTVDQIKDRLDCVQNMAALAALREAAARTGEGVTA